MEILIPTIGSSGDVIPFLTLGKALAKRGHQVTILANQVFKQIILENDLAFTELGSQTSYEKVTYDPDLWHPQKAFQLIAREFVLPSMRPLVEAIREFDPQKTLILACGFCFGARLVQEKWGYHTLTVHLQPAVLQSVYKPPRLGTLALPDWLPNPLTRLALNAIDRYITDPVLSPELNLYRSELFLQPVGNIFSHWMHSLEGVIGLFPEWFAPPQQDWPENTELTGFIGNPDDNLELSLDLLDFLDMGESPVLFTAGTSMQFGGSFFEESLEACQKLGCRGLFLTRDASQVPDNLPDSVLHVPYAPFQRLLPRCLAIVHHGGIGTISQAMKAGLPQLIVPFSHDQPDNAARVQELGAGDWIVPSRYRAARAAKRLEKIIDSRETREMAKLLASWINFDESLEKACQIIELHQPK